MKSMHSAALAAGVAAGSLVARDISTSAGRTAHAGLATLQPAGAVSAPKLRKGLLATSNASCIAPGIDAAHVRSLCANDDATIVALVDGDGGCVFLRSSDASVAWRDPRYGQPGAADPAPRGRTRRAECVWTGGRAGRRGPYLVGGRFGLCLHAADGSVAARGKCGDGNAVTAVVRVRVGGHAAGAAADDLVRAAAGIAGPGRGFVRLTRDGTGPAPPGPVALVFAGAVAGVGVALWDARDLVRLATFPTHGEVLDIVRIDTEGRCEGAGEGAVIAVWTGVGLTALVPVLG
jgi:hypothetical protein